MNETGPPMNGHYVVTGEEQDAQNSPASGISGGITNGVGNGIGRGLEAIEFAMPTSHDELQKAQRIKFVRNPFARRDSMFTKIFVGGLPYATGDEGLRKHFEQYGEIEEAVVIRDRQTGKSRGYGFVTMKAKEAAQLAVATPNPIIDGRKANVNLAYLGAKPRTNQMNMTRLQATVNAYRLQPVMPQSMLPPYIIANPSFASPFAQFTPVFTALPGPSNGHQPAYGPTTGLSLHVASDCEHFAPNLQISDQVFIPPVSPVYSSGMLAGSSIAPPPNLMHMHMQAASIAPRYQLSLHNRTA